MFSPEIIQQTREHFAQIDRDCIAGAQAGEFHVNDLSTYVEWCEDNIRKGMAGDWDHTFTFRQRAHWIATGECVPLFSN